MLCLTDVANTGHWSGQGDLQYMLTEAGPWMWTRSLFCFGFFSQKKDIHHTALKAPGTILRRTNTFSKWVSECVSEWRIVRPYDKNACCLCQRSPQTWLWKDCAFASCGEMQSMPRWEERSSTEREPLWRGVGLHWCANLVRWSRWPIIHWRVCWIAGVLKKKKIQTNKNPYVTL